MGKSASMTGTCACSFPKKSTAAARCIAFQVMPACKWRLSALPVLTDLNVRSAPVLEIYHFRLGLTPISTQAPSSQTRRTPQISTAVSGVHPSSQRPAKA